MSDTLTEWLDAQVYPKLNHEAVFGGLSGFRPAGAGRYVALCQLHSDTTPSLSMVDGQPFAYCYSCSETISWYRGVELQGFVGQAVIDELARLAAVPPLRASGDGKAREAAEALESWWQSCRSALWQPQGADVLAYLRGRGYPDDLTRLMDVGVQLEPLAGLRLPPAEYRLLIPARSAGGRILGFAARRLDGGEPKYQYSAGLRRNEILWGIHRLRRTDTPIVAEGVMDAMALAAHGLPVVAVGGSSLSSAQLKGLAPYRRVVLALDADSAGQSGTEKAVRSLMAVGTKVYVIPSFAGAKDPDEYVRRDGVDAFRSLVDRAESGWRWLVGRIVPSTPPTTDQERDEILTRVLDLAESLSRTDPVAGSEAVRETARRLALSEPALAEAVDRLSEGRRTRQAEETFRRAMEDARKEADWREAARKVDEARKEAASIIVLPPSPINVSGLALQLRDFPDGISFPWSTVNKQSKIDVGLTVIGAGTHHGKSTVGYNLILHYLQSYDGCVVLWSGEVDARIIFARLIGILSRTELSFVRKQFREGLFSAEVRDAANTLQSLQDRLIILDGPGQGVTDVDSVASMVSVLSRRKPITAVIVDYLQQLGAPMKIDGRYGSREQEVTATAKTLHELALSSRVPIIALAQINRDNHHYSERPKMAHLRESGAIEQYAGIVYGVWNSSIAGNYAPKTVSWTLPPEGWYWSEDDNQQSDSALCLAMSHGGILLEFSVQKHRLRGGCGRAVPLLFRPDTGQILDLPATPGPKAKEVMETVAAAAKAAAAKTTAKKGRAS